VRELHRATLSQPPRLGAEVGPLHVAVVSVRRARVNT
jgi:hypothetical protein